MTTDPRRLRVEARGRLAILVVWCVLLAVFSWGAWAIDGSLIEGFVTVARFGLPALLLCALVGVVVAAQAAARPARTDLVPWADAALWTAVGVVVLTWLALALHGQPLSGDAIGLSVQVVFVHVMTLGALVGVRRAAHAAAREPVSPPAARRSAA